MAGILVLPRPVANRLSGRRNIAGICALASLVICVTAATAGVARSAEAPLMRTAGDIKTAIDRLFVCDWAGSAWNSTCGIRRLPVSVTVKARPSDGIVDTVEVTALVAQAPRNPKAEASNRAAALRVVRLLLPKWSAGPRWVDRAMQAAVAPQTSRMIRIGMTTILVVAMHPVDVEAKYAAVIFTTRTSVDEWLPHTEE